MKKHLCVLVMAAAALFSCRIIASDGDKLTFYTRNTSYVGRVPLLVFRGIWDSTLLPFMNTEIGFSEGLVSSQQGQWGYKIEGTTHRFGEYFTMTGRLAKMNTFLPARSIETQFSLRFSTVVPADDFTLFSSLGLIVGWEDTKAGSVVLNFSGDSTFGAVFSLGARYHLKALKETYSLRLANFDVFDAYPVNTPFFQLDIDQDLGALKVFTYGRYRFNKYVDNLYAFYFTVGVKIPLGESKETSGTPVEDREEPQAKSKALDRFPASPDAKE